MEAWFEEAKRCEERSSFTNSLNLFSTSGIGPFPPPLVSNVSTLCEKQGKTPQKDAKINPEIRRKNVSKTGKRLD
ncbi:hypothetical protein LXL04_036844 [Taraxacum kok-saghyz]